MSARAVRVLMIDDDEDDFVLVKGLLRGTGDGNYDLAWASGYQTGLSALNAREYDVYLIDYRLGAQSGVELLQAARAGGVQEPIIMLTGRGDASIDRAALLAGAADYLVKGELDSARLSRAIRYAVDRARAAQALAESEARYRLLFERNPLPLWIYDVETLEFLAVNEAAVDHYGWSREEFLQMTLLDIRPPEDRELLQRSATQRHAGLQHAGLWRHRRRDGSNIEVEIIAHTLDWLGRPAELVLAKDVTAEQLAKRELRERAVQFRQLLSDTIDALAVVGSDGRIRFANPAFERLLGAPMRGEMLEEMPLPVSLALEPGQEQVLEIGPERRVAEAKAASTMWEGEPARILALRDITDRRQVERRLRLLQRAIEASVNAVLISDLRQPDMPLIYVNAAFEQTTGYRAEEALGRNCRFLQGEDREQPEIDVMRRALAERRECEVVLRNYRRDGSMFWNQLTLSPVRESDGAVSYYVGVMNDLTDRRRYEAELAYAASHDAVTGLPRIIVLEEYLSMALVQGEREQQRVAVLHVDLDRFHTVNETLGHAIGDQALRETAERLRAGVGAMGRICRLGGDEFVVALMLGADADPMAIAESLRVRVEVPVEIAPYKLYITCTIGVSVYPEHGGASEELLRRAEAALTRAKKHARNSVQMFSNEHAHELKDRIALGSRLRDAIARNELVLHYQPQVSAANGRIVGVEALVRWQTQDLGLLPPARFIRVAEELGLIVDLGRWVLEEACRQARHWANAGFTEMFVAVNVSALQLQRPAFVEEVRAVVQRHDLPPAMLELELTESAIMENVERMAETMRALKKLGVRLALDDFGIGYSSLNYLKRFPIDKLKIDQSFVREITESHGDAAIVRAIIAMGHQLQMTVMAEGVESEAQLGFLRRNHCDECQGMFFGMPAPPLDVGALLAQRFLNTQAFAATHDERTLLLLDDEENVLNALTRLLRRDGYRILIAHNAAEAFDLLARHGVEVVVSDQRMPDISGTEFLSRVKEMYPETVRLVLSGYTDLRTVTDAINRGAIYKFLTKPWDDADLREQIRLAFRTFAERRRGSAAL